MPRAFMFSEYGGPEVASFTEVPKPIPAEGQVLVAVRASGVNPADWKRRRGLGPQGGPLDGPVVLGRDPAGVVEAVGPGVSEFAVGDEVFGVPVPALGGSFAEYTILSVDQMARKPAKVSFNDAATLSIAGATAYDGVVQLDPKAGETLLIVGGGGGVGIAATQLAVHRGARVIGIASAGKKELVESFGATHVAYGTGVLDRIKAVSPDGVDAIFDTVGGDALKDVADCVGDKSRLISIADPKTAEALGGQFIDRKRNSAVLEAVGGLVESGVLKPSVTEIFPFDQAAAALAMVEDGHATGKVVLEVS